MTKLATTEDALAVSMDDLLERAAAYGREAKSPATRRAYERQWFLYEAWCQKLAVPAMRADGVDIGMVVRYIGWLADKKAALSTVLQSVAAIAYRQRAHGFVWHGDNAALQAVLEGVRRTLGERPRNQKAPIGELELRKMVGTCGDSLLDVRDRALLLVGWLGAFRRSELVALDTSDLTFVEDGLEVLVRRSKTDQKGQGLTKALPFTRDDGVCPVLATKEWLKRASIESGPVFLRLGRDERIGPRLSGAAVAEVVKSRAARAGIDASKYSGHSLRSGFVTTAADREKSLDAIMRQTGHKSPASVLIYIRHANLFRHSAARDLL